MRYKRVRTVALAILIFLFSIGVVLLSYYLDMLIIHSGVPDWMKYRR